MLRRSLRRLQAGDGGFYEADDLQQDLFIEFWALARDWQASGEDEAALWAAWRRRLWGQGCHILRRRPQRLWDRAEYPVAPDRLALDASDDEPAAVEGLPTAARQALTAGEDAAATHDQLAELSRLETPWGAAPYPATILYMVTLGGLPAPRWSACSAWLPYGPVPAPVRGPPGIAPRIGQDARGGIAMISTPDVRIARLLWALDQENRRLLRLLRAGYGLAAADEALGGRAPFHSSGACRYDKGRRTIAGKVTP